MARTTNGIGWATALLGALGCNGGGIDSGVQGDKPVSELSSSEARDLCEAIDAYGRVRTPPSYVHDRLCTVRGLSSASSPADCATVRESCLSSPPSDTLFAQADCSVARATADCDASVDNVEACFTDEIDLFPCASMPGAAATPETSPV